MRRIGLLLAAVAVPALAGCEAITGCKKESAVVELDYASPFYAVQQGLLTGYENRGWTCKRDGAIRNAFGREIGARYVCTGCA